MALHCLGPIVPRTRFVTLGFLCAPMMATLACSSSPGSASQDGGTGAGGLTIAPATAHVLTCSTLQFTETGGPAGGAWTVAPATGTVSATGDYTAPTVAPANPAVTVAYGAGAVSASAQIQVATAFVGAAAPVAIHTMTDNPLNNPFEHQMTANGSQVYIGLTAAAVAGAETPLEADVFASTDNGKTFTGPTAYHTGDVECATIAVDSGNASVVYLAYLAGHGDSSSNTGETLRLAVSTDGAKTFATEYDLVDSINSIASFICPDVTSPSPGHVIVAGVSADDNGAHIATFVSGNEGANIGPVSQESVMIAPNPDGGEIAATDTNVGSATGCQIYSNGSAGSPRVFSNGHGTACTVFQYNTFTTCTSPSNIAVQCSGDNGATWTSPVALGAPQADATGYPTGAVSPSGKVAITWIDTIQTDAGTPDIVTFVAFSHDGGKTFGDPDPIPTSVERRARRKLAARRCLGERYDALARAVRQRGQRRQRLRGQDVRRRRDLERSGGRRCVPWGVPRPHERRYARRGRHAVERPGRPGHRDDSARSVTSLRARRTRRGRETRGAIAGVDARGQPARAAAAIDSTSLAARAIVRAFQFSSTCSGRLVPGMGRTTGERARSHASAICAGVARWRSAAAATALPGVVCAPTPSGKNGMNAMPRAVHMSSTRSGDSTSACVSRAMGPPPPATL